MLLATLVTRLEAAQDISQSCGMRSVHLPPADYAEMLSHMRRLRDRGDDEPEARMFEVMPPWVKEIVESHAAKAGVTVQRLIAGAGADRQGLAGVRAAVFREIRARPWGKSGKPPPYGLIGAWFCRDHTSILHAVREK